MKTANLFLLGALSASALAFSACGDDATGRLRERLRVESDFARRAAIAQYIECVEDADAGRRVDATGALALAVALDDAAGVKRFLDEGADPRTSVAGESLLSIAVLRTHDLEVAGLLAAESSATKEELGALLVAAVAADVPADGKKPSDGEIFFSDADERAKTIEFLIARGADVNAKSSAGDSALEIAVAKKDGATRDALLDRGALPDAGALFAAVAAGDAEAPGDAESADALLAHGADANARAGKLPVLAIAVEKGDVRTAKVLLNRGADVNATIVAGKKPVSLLAVAAASGNVEMARLFLDRGADATGGETAAGMPLVGAVVAKNEVLTEMLVSRGASFSEPAVLKILVSEGREDGVAYVLGKGVVPGADVLALAGKTSIRKKLVEAGAPFGQALTESVRRGDRDFSEWLLSRGAKPSAADVDAAAERGSDFAFVRALVNAGAPATPRALAHFLAKKNAEAVDFLLSRGVKPDVSVDGVPAVVFAAREGDLALMKKLVEKGAPATPVLARFVAENDLETVGFLLAHGADPNVEIAEDVPAVAAAAKDGNVALARALVEAGADAVPALPGFIGRRDAEAVEFLRTKISDASVFEAFPKLEPMVVFAARNRNSDLVKLLVEKGADPTPVLAHYVAAGDEPMAEWLLRHRARLDDRLVALAVRSGKTSLVKLFIEQGGASATPALPGYVERQDETMVRWLLEKRADANAVSEEGVPAVVIAAKAPSVSIMKRLVDAGADATLALPFYVVKSDPATIDYLLGRGANPNATVADGVSVVALAAGKHDDRVLEKLVNAGGNASDALPYYLESRLAQELRTLDFLLARGADARMRVRGVPVVICAARLRNDAVVRKLVEKGANASVALPWFAENKRQSFDVAEFLLRSGADANTLVGVIPVSAGASGASEERASSVPVSSSSDTETASSPSSSSSSSSSSESSSTRRNRFSSGSRRSR